MKKISGYTVLHRIIAAAVVVLIALAVFFEGSLTAPLSSYAESSTVAAYESQNVLDDLDGSTIAGNEFSLSDYPYNENGRPQVLNFVEFAYSYYSYLKDDYNLYVYVYNPEGYAFDDNSELNAIEMTVGSLAVTTYSLEIVNYSTASGYEGLFYKFKVVLSDSLRESLLSSLDQTARAYTIAGIELSVGGNIVDYEVGSTYTYSGYSLGYGSSAATESSLSCSVDGFDNYLSLDVTHTTYRLEGDYYDGEQSQLDSVYFTVPNTYFEDYGELTNIACEWYEYITNPILVTESVSIYNAMNSLYGQTLDNVSDGYDYLFCISGNTDSSWFSKSANGYYLSNLAYEDETISWWNGFTYCSKTFSANTYSQGFAGVFYTGGESYDGYSVSTEDILAKLKSYSQKLGDTSICGKYAAALFDSDYEGAGYSGVVDVNIADTRELFSNTTSKEWWEYIFGGYSVSTDYDYVPALLTFSDYEVLSDYEGVHYSYEDLSDYDTSAISDSFFIGKSEVDDFLATCKEAQKNDETVVLMRFSSSTYISQPCAQAQTSSSDDSKTTLAKECHSQWDDSDYSAYVFQETVYLNFDIISLTFTLDDVETVIPVVMSPVDLASDSTPPLEEDYGDENWWQKVLAVVALVLICVLFAPILPYVAKGIVWVISLPVKLVTSIVQAVSSSSNKNKKE